VIGGCLTKTKKIEVAIEVSPRNIYSIKDSTLLNNRTPNRREEEKYAKKLIKMK
jgi:hypothetical protein